MGRLTAALLLLTGCAAFWPGMVQPAPERPLFEPRGLLAGGTRVDGALCSLASVGPDTTLLVQPPPLLTEPVPLVRACAGGAAFAPGTLVQVDTAQGPVLGFLTLPAGAAGVLVAFSGMGMPADGWVNHRLAQGAARRGLATLAVVRDESSRPIVLDPLREARRGLEAGRVLRERCGLDPARPLALVGISLGGLEALLAGREGAERRLEAHAAVLDPVLDVGLAAAHLDSFWHGLADDAMQGYFQRILRGRWAEPASTRFTDVLARLEQHPGAQTDPRRDTPSAWLCAAPRERFSVFLSTTDPVLGEEQREGLRSCGVPLLDAATPGHTPFACRLELFDLLLDAAAGGPRPPAPR